MNTKLLVISIALDAQIRTDQDQLFTLANLLLGDVQRAEAAVHQACEAAYQRLIRSGPAPLREALYASLVGACATPVGSQRPHFWRLSADRRAVPQDCLSRLPYQTRAALVLVELAGFRYAEVGRILGCSLGEVCQQVAAGRRMLAKSLAGRGVG